MSSTDLVKKLESEEIEFPNIIISDLNMPIMTGFQMMDEIRKLPKYNSSIKTYIQSALVNPKDLDFIENSNTYSGHYEKFITIEQVNEIIENLV